MKQKLKLHIWRTNCTVHMQVLDQEGITDDISEEIRTFNELEISDNYMYLRGFRKIGNDIITNLILESEQQAIDYIKKVVSWLDEVFTPKEPKRGDWVKINEEKHNNHNKRIYLSTIKGADYPYICVSNTSEQDFINGKNFSYDVWKYIQPLTSNWDSENGIYEAEREV